MRCFLSRYSLWSVYVREVISQVFDEIRIAVVVLDKIIDEYIN